MNEGDTSFCEEVLLSIFSELEDRSWPEAAVAPTFPAELPSSPQDKVEGPEPRGPDACLAARHLSPSSGLAVAGEANTDR